MSALKAFADHQTIRKSDSARLKLYVHSPISPLHLFPYSQQLNQTHLETVGRLQISLTALTKILLLTSTLVFQDLVVINCLSWHCDKMKLWMRYHGLEIIANSSRMEERNTTNTLRLEWLNQNIKSTKVTELSHKWELKFLALLMSSC